MSQLSKKIKIKVERLSKSFLDHDGRRLDVLDNVSFNVYDGEFLCIVGPSGCGKTTLLRIIAGLETPSAGHVTIERENPTKPAIGFVFQEDSLFPWRTVWDNVKFGLELMKITNADQIVARLIDLMGLRGFERYYPSQLSAGMYRRVVIAQAWAINPEILLMDEPFANLDAQTRCILQDELQSIWNKLKRTVLFVTHNIEEAVYLADRIIVLSPRPSKVKTEIEINIPRPRDRFDPEITLYRRKIVKLVADRYRA